MKEDYKVRYWREALECALDEIGASDKLTKEEIAAVAASLEASAESSNIGDWRAKKKIGYRKEESSLQRV